MSDPGTVVLTWAEYASAAHVGLLRHAVAESHGFTPRTTRPGWTAALEANIFGAAGELALAKYAGAYWPMTVDGYRTTPDISVLGHPVEVRTAREPDGRLIVRDDDDPRQVFVLVIGDPPRFRVVGSITGKSARRPEWRRDPGGHRPAWFVPQTALVPVPRDPHSSLSVGDAQPIRDG